MIKINMDKVKYIFYIGVTVITILFLFFTTALFLEATPDCNTVEVEQIHKQSEYHDNLYLIHTYTWVVNSKGYKENLEYENHVSYIQTNNVQADFLLEQEYIKAKQVKIRLEVINNICEE